MSAASLRIVFWCIAAATIYGIVHDEITVRVCLEYFTIGHPAIWFATGPTSLAVTWGILATWWVGLGLGVILAMAARLGSAPKRRARDLVMPVLRVLAFAGACSLLFGLIGWVLAKAGDVKLVGRLATDVPADRHVAFLADLWAHSASYAAGFFGGLVIAVRLWRARQAEALVISSKSGRGDA